MIVCGTQILCFYTQNVYSIVEDFVFFLSKSMLLEVDDSLNNNHLEKPFRDLFALSLFYLVFALINFVGWVLLLVDSLRWNLLKLSNKCFEQKKER